MADFDLIEKGLKMAANDHLGTSYTPDPRNGCCYFATIIASYYSSWAKNEYDLGIVYVPTLVNHAKEANMYEDFNGSFEIGDILVFGDEDHVVVATGGDTWMGNSTSRRCMVKGSDYHYIGLPLTGIIKTSRSC